MKFMYRDINESEKKQIKNKLEWVKASYKVFLGKDKFFNTKFFELSLNEIDNFINYFHLDQFNPRDIQSILGKEVTPKLKEIGESIIHIFSTGANNYEILKMYAEKVVFLKKISDLDGNYIVDSNNFHYNFFKMLCEYYSIPDDIIKELKALTLGDDYYRDLYSEDEYEEHMDEIYDNMQTTYDLDYVMQKLADHFNIFYISCLKSEFGKRAYYSEQLDTYFDEDFEMFRDSVPFDKYGYVEEDYDYYSLFESDGDMVLYFKKYINEDIQYNIEVLSPTSSQDFYLAESSLISDEEGAYTKWHINNNCLVQGLNYALINVLLISLGGYKKW